MKFDIYPPKNKIEEQKQKKTVYIYIYNVDTHTQTNKIKHFQLKYIRQHQPLGEWGVGGWGVDSTATGKSNLGLTCKAEDTGEKCQTGM